MLETHPEDKTMLRSYKYGLL